MCSYVPVFDQGRYFQCENFSLASSAIDTWPLSLSDNAIFRSGLTRQRLLHLVLMSLKPTVRESQRSEFQSSRFAVLA